MIRAIVIGVLVALLAVWYWGGLTVGSGFVLVLVTVVAIDALIEYILHRRWVRREQARERQRTEDLLDRRES